MMNEPLDRLPLAEKVARALHQQLLDARVPDGAKLPTEAALQNRFGVSRTTIRASMGILKTLGIVTIRQGDGTYYTQKSLTGKENKGFAEDSFENHLEAFAFTVKAIIELCQKRASLSDIKEIQEKLVSWTESQAKNDVVGFHAAKQDFYFTLAASVHNPVLETNLRQVYGGFLQVYEKNISSMPGSQLNAASCILDALRYRRIIDVDKTAIDIINSEL